MTDTPTLLELQRSARRAIALGDDAALESLIVADGIRPSERIAIYRATAFGTLVKALRLSHPVVQRLVGAEFFEAAVAGFLPHGWPTSAWLDDFGADFAVFLQGFAPAASLPYLGDVARLEWAVHLALHAPEAPVLPLERLLHLDEAQGRAVRFRAHPSLRLLELGTPADAIWRAVLEDDDDALAALDPAPVPLWLLVQRRADGGVDVLRVAAAEWRFVAALVSETPLQQVLERFAGEAPDLALDQILARHLAAGRFADFTVALPGS